MQPLLDFVERNYLGSCVQKQSLTVTVPLSAHGNWNKLNEKKFSGLVDLTARLFDAFIEPGKSRRKGETQCDS